MATIYTCYECKAAPLPKNGWRRNYEWKTLRGFDNHKCYKDAFERAAKARRDKQDRAQLFAQWLGLGILDYAVGDDIFYCAYDVTSLTHLSDGRRVRYEERRHYFGAEGEVTSIRPLNERVDIDAISAAIRDKSQLPAFYIVRNLHTVAKPFASLAEARAEAEAQQSAYDAHCKLSSELR